MLDEGFLLQRCRMIGQPPSTLKNLTQDPAPEDHLAGVSVAVCRLSRHRGTLHQGLHDALFVHDDARRPRIALWPQQPCGKYDNVHNHKHRHNQPTRMERLVDERFYDLFRIHLHGVLSLEWP